MSRIIGTVAVTVGCVIGAGFASGRELLIFFEGNYHNAGAAAFVFFILFFAVCAMFLFNGRNFRPKDFAELDKHICGKASKIFDVMFVVNYFLIICSMLAASQTLFEKLAGDTGFPLYSFLCAVLCGVALCFGIDGIKNINIILLPAILFFIALVTVQSVDKLDFGTPDFSVVSQSANYAGMNAMIMCGVLTMCGKKLTKKEIYISAAVSAAILSVMIFLILKSLSGESFIGIEMPLLYIAKRFNVAYVMYGIVILLSVITTIMSAALPLAEWGEKYIYGRKTAILVILGLAFCISIFGFVSLMNWTTQIFTITGICFVFANILTLIKRNASIKHAYFTQHK